MVFAAPVLVLALAVPPPRLLNLRVDDGGRPYAGDRRRLATVSPNGDGLRDSAIVRFRLDRPAAVTLRAVATDTIRDGRPAETVVWSTRARLRPGAHRFVWTPARSTAPRTYILRLTAAGAGGTRAYGGGGPATAGGAPVVRVLDVQAAFDRRSYAPGQTPSVTLSTDAKAVKLQVFAYANLLHPTERDLRTSGVAMTPPVRLDWRDHRDAPQTVRVVRAGPWPSGLYFLRVTAEDGRVGYAPLIVRPTRPSARVAVVLSTNTWQAYNFDDENGDGWGDSWYVSGAIRTVDLARPYLDFGVPFRFKDWDLTFVAWLNRTGKRADVLSDDDLEAFRSGDALARAYDLVVFPGHEEYTTEHAYGVLRRYRDLGGNLMFLSANNLFWKVRRTGSRLVRVREWRDLGRPEASLVGVQYVASNHGEHQEPYVVTGASAAPWAFAGTGLADGSQLGTRYGIEIDARTAASPPGTQVLARIPDLMGPGRSAEMTEYETAWGARVFAAGTLDFAASLDDPAVAQLVENVWARLSKP
jgi:hypothetical protein